MARALRIISVALITIGIVIVSDAALTLAWKEPLSAIYSSLRQSEAADELETVEADFQALPQVDAIEVEQRRTEEAARELAGVFARTMETGKAIGRIEIGAIDADYVVVQGTDTADLQKGPGHYPDTALPGEGRTIGIAGHRTTYGAPFNRINELEEGDEIALEMPYGTFRYEVTESKIVDPDQVEVVDDVGRERLVLSACHPLYSAAQRYIIFADLAEIELAGAGAGSG